MKSIVYTAILAASLMGCTRQPSAVEEILCTKKYQTDILYGSRVRVWSGFYAGHFGTVLSRKYVSATYSKSGAECETAGFVVRIYDTDAGMIEAKIAQYDLYAVQKEN